MTERKISGASQYMDEQAHALLERAGYLKEGFNTDNSQAHDTQGQGSQMVQDDRASHDNRPPPDMARDVDRESFNDRWSREQEAARNYEQEMDYENER